MKTEERAGNGHGERDGNTGRIGANKTDPRSGYRKYQIMRTVGEIQTTYCPMCELREGDSEGVRWLGAEMKSERELKAQYVLNLN